MKHADDGLESLKNLGPVSRKWLVESGISSRSELERIGAVMAYKIIKHREPAASLNLLYGLQAALLNIHWTALSPEMKAQLKAEAGIPLEIKAQSRTDV